MIAVFASEAIKQFVSLSSGVTLGEPIRSVDGRVACCHPFTEEDIAALVAAGAEVRETLPEDWVSVEQVE